MSGAPILELERVNSFYGGAHILHDVSLRLEAGEVVALLGRNGAGKSTTLKSIIGLVSPRSGAVRLRGENVAGWAPHRVSRLRLGYVPEERRIFKKLTVLENLEVGRRPAAEGARAWTLEALFELFPNLAERRGNLGGHLSGGEQQMLSIARTLMGGPTALLLDEPSEGVAPVIVEQMAHAIDALKAEGLAMLLSEQNARFAERVSDRAYIIESGRIRFEGAMAALAADPETRERYLAV